MPHGFAWACVGLSLQSAPSNAKIRTHAHAKPWAWHAAPDFRTPRPPVTIATGYCTNVITRGGDPPDDAGQPRTAYARGQASRLARSAWPMGVGLWLHVPKRRGSLRQSRTPRRIRCMAPLRRPPCRSPSMAFRTATFTSPSSSIVSTSRPGPIRSDSTTRSISSRSRTPCCRPAWKAASRDDADRLGPAAARQRPASGRDEPAPISRRSRSPGNGTGPHDLRLPRTGARLRPSPSRGRRPLLQRLSRHRPGRAPASARLPRCLSLGGDVRAARGGSPHVRGGRRAHRQSAGLVRDPA